MEIEVKRHESFYFWKTIFPLCLIVIMSWVPRWIDPKEIGTNIGVSTTSFLTLVAYLFAITVLLPRVSYLTRMDQFIFLSTLMVFISLLQTVGITIFLGKMPVANLKRINLLSRITYPALLVVVLVVSFVV
jgi:hypothetical protein